MRFTRVVDDIAHGMVLCTTGFLVFYTGQVIFDVFQEIISFLLFDRLKKKSFLSAGFIRCCFYINMSYDWGKKKIRVMTKMQHFMVPSNVLFL